MKIPSITPLEIIERYEVILLDAFGVLVYQQGPLPGAIQFIQKLNECKKTYYILTNDAAHLLTTSEQRFRKLGFEIAESAIITSGSLLSEYFQHNHLIGQGCAVLGTKDSCQYVRNAGGNVVPIGDEAQWDVLVVCDEMGFPFLEYVDSAMSGIFAKMDRKNPPHLVLCNPDFIYRKTEHQFGITAGSIALIIENALKMRYPHNINLQFQRLGKPFPPMFETAYRRSGTKNMVMIGDQLAYDIRGAKSFGIHAILMETGVIKLSDGHNISQFDSLEIPDYILPSWD